MAVNLPHMFYRIIAFLYCLFLLSCPAYATSAVTPLSLEPRTEGLLITDHDLPMVSLQLTFLYAGGVSDPATKAGRANLGAQLLMEGAGDYDGQEFRRLLESKAIKMGAVAGMDNVSISLKTLSKNLPEALRLLTLLVTQPRFSAESLARKQEEIRTDLRQAAQDPSWLAGRAWNERAYGKHPYGRALEGTDKTLSALTVSDVKAWHASALTKDRLKIAVVGDVEAADLTRALQQLITALPENSTLAIPAEAPIPPVNLPPIMVKKDVPQSIAIFGLPALKRSDPDFYAVYLLNQILGGGTLTSRLSHAIREEKGLAYYAASSLSMQQFSPVLLGSFATRNEKIGDAVSELRKVLTRTATQGVTAKELQNAKDYITGSFPLEIDTQSERASYLSAMMVYDLGDDYLTRRNDYFRAVTLTQVNRLAKTLLSPAPLLVVAGNPKKAL